MDKNREQQLDGLIDACWAHHAWVKGLRCNCNFKHSDPNAPKRTLPDAEFDRILPENEIPILWFGDIEAYDASPRKIVTVGLNPSDREFAKSKSDCDQGKSSMFRFEDATSLSGWAINHLDDEQRELYKNALNSYFLPKKSKSKRKDAKRIATCYGWFGYWRPVLEGMDAAFETGAKSYTVIHTDFITPVATTPAWTKFGAKLPCVHEAIEVKSRELKLWKQLMQILEPDLILAAVADNMAKEIASDLETSNEDQPGFSDQNKKRKWTLAETNVFGKRSLFVNVPPEGRTPFSFWGHDAKIKFGETVHSMSAKSGV